MLAFLIKSFSGNTIIYFFKYLKKSNEDIGFEVVRCRPLTSRINGIFHRADPRAVATGRTENDCTLCKSPNYHKVKENKFVP